MLYYDAAMLVNMLQWWKQKKKPTILEHWATGSFNFFIQMGMVGEKNYIPGYPVPPVKFKSLKSIWKKHQHVLAPGQIPTGCFLSHPGYQTALRCLDFTRWGQTGMGKYYQLWTPSGIISEHQVITKFGIHSNISFLICKLETSYSNSRCSFNVFISLTSFETLVIAMSSQKHLLSKLYAILLLEKQIDDGIKLTWEIQKQKKV